MAEMVVGAFLTVYLEVLHKRIASIVDLFTTKGVDDELLDQLEIKLSSVNGVLNDAEKKQVTDPRVRRWLEKLKDAIHNAEDLLDEINTEALRCEIEKGGQSTGSHLSLSQVRTIFFSDRLEVTNLETRMKKILIKLEYIAKEKDNLGLKEGVVEGKAYPYNRGPSETTLVKGSNVYGRDADKKAITDLLLSEDEEVGGDHKVPVISIVAMGGMGKTTLAQLVYHEIDSDAKLSSKKYFDFKIWITVSEEFDVFTLTEKIYKKALPDSQNRLPDEGFELQGELEKILKGKKFLLVLDDVWNEDFRGWFAFKTPLESAAHGSKILVTTRSGKIASMMDDVPNHCYQLKGISEEDGWKLFKKHAFSNKAQNAYDLADLEKTGRRILKRCQGLPLAIESLAGLLRCEIHDSSEWKKILESDIWDLPKECHILPALWLSYYYLPPPLKGCFAYCSIFPKDYPIEKGQLIRLWMAQDLLQPQKTKTLEEVGEEYIKDLTSRSFFHVYEHDRVIMHDLVNDLAKFVSGESCLRLDDNNYSDGLMRKTRHFSYVRCDTQEDIKKFKVAVKNTVLRTLLGLEKFYAREEEYSIQPNELQQMRALRVFSPSLTKNKPLSTQIPDSTQMLDSIGSLKLLRFLDLSNTGIKEIPDSICTLYNLQTLLLIECSTLIGLSDSIGNLKKLRYLDLSESKIEKIPETICNLQELHALLLAGCSKLRCLPTNITTLTSLSHLDIFGTTWLKELPRQMSNLENLRTLREFIVSKDSGARIEELGKLQHLRGDMHIKNLENVVDVEDASKAVLKDKKHITRLELEWGWNGDTVVDSSRGAREVLDGLQPHTNLESLCLRNYGGTNFSQWVGCNSFSCIKSVELQGCKYCCQLPPLGQLPSLERLEIQEFGMVERVGSEFYGSSSSSSSSSSSDDGWCDSSATGLPFRSLKRLTFHDMPEWKEWSSSMNMKGYKEVVDRNGCVFSNLKELRLESCPKLGGGCLPDYISWVSGNT